MTGANLMNVSAVNGNFAGQSERTARLQEDSVKAAEIFAGLMYQTSNISTPQSNSQTTDQAITKTLDTGSAVKSYERYGYKEKQQIGEAAKTTDVETADAVKDAMESVQEDIVDAVSDAYDVSEEEIQDVLEQMGLNVLDLLNPQNLAGFIVELTGMASGEELLLDENFLNIMETMDALTQGLMQELGVNADEMQQLIGQMQPADDEMELPGDFQDILAEQNSREDGVTETLVTEETVQDQEVVDEAADISENAADVEVVDGRSEKDRLGSETETDVQSAEDDVFSNAMVTKDASLSNGRNSNDQMMSDQNPNPNEIMQNSQIPADVSQTGAVTQSFSSYISADAMQIMDQIVQQMRVTISTDVSSMEMQLNPENLGKVYVHITSEEGTVNAQFHATNEIVKEALESQVATLRENLNQAGVKVDAIEVTVESHEFERNLDQNHQNPEQQVETQNTATQKRRNLTIDALDELSGVMTEEETLVAQIMKDNGNSIDLTA